VEQEQMLTVPQVAARLGANPYTIRRWLREGRIKGVMPGGTKLGYRIPESEVRRLLNVGGTGRSEPEGEAAA
jgi:excisionase family DNA binding protein